jgi:hypothetical protein
MLEHGSSSRWLAALLGVAALLVLAAAPAHAQRRESVFIRGHAQSLYLYGPVSGEPVIVSSGDGGWLHLGPHVAEFLGANGFFAVGFDVRAYLESFTSRRATLQPDDAPHDFEVLAEFARQKTGRKPILIGVSEGAGLSVLAATDSRTRAAITGVIGLGLPDVNELAWRWKDALIYLTHGVPAEPTFSTAAIVGRVSPAPLAAIHSTHDEFVPLADVQRVLSGAREPKRLWTVRASNHRFSDNLAEFDRTLLEAIAWVRANSAR